MWRGGRIVRSFLSLLRFGFLLGEVFAEAVETTLPTRAPSRDPLLGFAQRRGVDLARADAAGFFGSDEPTPLQHLQMLEDRRKRDGERLGELADGRRSAAQALHHRPAG